MKRKKNGEEGIALITALLASTIMLALGMAVVMSATTGTIVTRSQRVSGQSFSAADAGIAVARRALVIALQQDVAAIQAANAGNTLATGSPASGATGSAAFPPYQVLPDPAVSPAHYAAIVNNAKVIAADSARAQKMNTLDGTSFSINYNQLTGTVTNIPTSATQATTAVVLRYAIQVTGTTSGGGSATVDETGVVSTNIQLTNGPVPVSPWGFSFSGFAAFFDQGDPIWYAVLSPGVYSGPVHTNTHFAFYSGWQYTFRNEVSQVDPTIRYWTGDPNNTIPIPTSSIQGINLSSEGYKQTGVVPLPSNAFSQEYAVINGQGLTTQNPDGSPVYPPPVIPVDGNGNPVPILDANGKVTTAALVANLRTANNQVPVPSSGSLPTGVYVASADGASISGAGFYVQGDASDMKVYADNGDQVYVIQQAAANGSTQTTTIRVSSSSNTTTVNSGTTTTIYTGVPIDRSDPNNPAPGTIVYANGSIWSLRGGVDNGSNAAAIASQTHLNITAARHIKLTGDLKYTDPVVNSDGTPVSNINSVQNVLGLFTNDGNIYLDAKSGYVSGPGLSIEMDGAFAVFDSNPSNNGGASEGGITTWFGAGHQSPSGGDRIRLVGSDVEKNNSLVDYYNADEFFDVRFSGGTFRPPFFPGTAYTQGTVPTTGYVAISNPGSPVPTGITWFRENR